MKNVLILSNCLEGHRQVYCHVLTEVSLRQGLRVTIAANRPPGDPQRHFPYVDYYDADPRVTVVDVGYLGAGGVSSPRDFAALVGRCSPDLVVVPEADSHLALLASSVLPFRRRFQGRIVGIFIRSANYIYGQSRLPKCGGRDTHFPRPWPSDPILFHEFLVPHRHPVDAALSLDENFVECHQHTHTWLPDMYKPFDEIAATFRDADRDLWIERLDEFCERNSGRFRLFYFGVAQARRGYQTLLRLARDEDACFIHCGSNGDQTGYGPAVRNIRDVLRQEGRLLATGRFVGDPVLVRHFFRCADRMVLPYDNFWGSSGVMLQALEYGQPVLVASQGLMGWRVKNNSLGMTFAGGDYEDLRGRFRVFRALSASDFQEPIRRFMDSFRRESLETVLAKALFSGG